MLVLLECIQEQVQRIDGVENTDPVEIITRCYQTQPHNSKKSDKLGCLLQVEVLQERCRCL